MVLHALPDLLSLKFIAMLASETYKIKTKNFRSNIQMEGEFNAKDIKRQNELWKMQLYEPHKSTKSKY